MNDFNIPIFVVISMMVVMYVLFFKEKLGKTTKDAGLICKLQAFVDVPFKTYNVPLSSSGAGIVFVTYIDGYVDSIKLYMRSSIDTLKESTNTNEEIYKELTDDILKMRNVINYIQGIDDLYRIDNNGFYKPERWYIDEYRRVLTDTCSIIQELEVYILEL